MLPWEPMVISITFFLFFLYHKNQYYNNNQSDKFQEVKKIHIIEELTPVAMVAGLK